MPSHPFAHSRRNSRRASIAITAYTFGSPLCGPPSGGTSLLVGLTPIRPFSEAFPSCADSCCNASHHPRPPVVPPPPSPLRSEGASLGGTALLALLGVRREGQVPTRAQPAEQSEAPHPHAWLEFARGKVLRAAWFPRLRWRVRQSRASLLTSRDREVDRERRSTPIPKR